MAHIDDGGGSKKSTSVDVNIVPFIDLMSVLIIFLLISAVWTQVSMIQIGSSVYGQKTSDEKPKPPPKAEIPFRVDVKSTGFNVVIGSNNIPIPKVNNEFDTETLLKELKQIKATYQDKDDAVVTMADELQYKYLIMAMDALLTAEFSQVVIATGGVQ